MILLGKKFLNDKVTLNERRAYIESFLDEGRPNASPSSQEWVSDEYYQGCREILVKEVREINARLRALDRPRNRKVESRTRGRVMTKTRTKTRTAKPTKPAKLTKAQINQLHGFAKLKYTDPDRLAEISAKAGKKAQKLHGKRVRWSAAAARRMSAKGGRAIQKLWRAGDPRVTRGKAKPRAKLAPHPKRRKSDVARKRTRKLAGSPVETQTEPVPVTEPVPENLEVHDTRPEPEPEPEAVTAFSMPSSATVDESVDHGIPEDDGLDEHGQPRIEDLV